MMEHDLLKKYVCITPFTYLELHKHGIFSCCPSWLPNKMGDLSDLDNVWESDELKKVQESILNGSYEYCSKTQCPYLSKLINGTGVGDSFVPKSVDKKYILSDITAPKVCSGESSIILILSTLDLICSEVTLDDVAE
jgi:hypothetical protein